MKKLLFAAVILSILVPFTSLAQKGELKVMSYNIRMGGANDGDNSCLDELDKMMTSTRKIALKSDNEGTFNGWGRVPYISDHYPIISVLEF